MSSVPYFLPTSRGVVVASQGSLWLISRDLQRVYWRASVSGTSSGLVVEGGVLTYGPHGPESSGTRSLTEFDLKDGSVLRVVTAERSLLVGTTARSLLFSSVERPRLDLICIDRETLGERWRRPGHSGVSVAPSSSERYLVPTRWGLSLECIDAANGERLWVFEPPGGDGGLRPLDRPNRIGAGFPSIVAVEDRVIVTTMQGRVFALAADNGEILRTGDPPFRGAFVVTRKAVFFKQAFGLSEFDHGEMREVARTEYQDDVAPMYRGHRPTVSGFWLTEDSIVWTTPYGALMGHSRHPIPDEGSRAWVDELPGAVMPLGRSPVGFGGYLYYASQNEGVGGGGLLAYHSAGDCEPPDCAGPHA